MKRKLLQLFDYYRSSGNDSLAAEIEKVGRKYQMEELINEELSDEEMNFFAAGEFFGKSFYGEKEDI